MGAQVWESFLGGAPYPPLLLPDEMEWTFSSSCWLSLYPLAVVKLGAPFAGAYRNEVVLGWVHTPPDMGVACLTLCHAKSVWKYFQTVASELKKVGGAAVFWL